jgi:hypothetical protein
MVLGKRFVARSEDAVAWAEGEWGADEFEERPLYSLLDPAPLTVEDFRSIYE